MDLKGEAPLHVVVIDEIDSMYSHKKEIDLPDSSVLTQFLTELDPFFDDNGEDCKNLLVIGIAHRNFDLPDSVLRNGRFGRHVLVKPPTAEGREQIFKIYLDSYLRNSRVAKDFDLEELVRMTEGTSGAYIEGLISQAVLHCMRRAASKNVMPAELSSSPFALLEMGDFRAARELMVQDDKWKHFYL